MLTMSVEVESMAVICTGLARPVITGPMTVPPPSFCSSFDAMCAE